MSVRESADSNMLGRLAGISLTRRQVMKSAGLVGAASLLAPALAACGSETTTDTAPSAAGSPVKGGRLRLGVIGGSENDTWDMLVAVAAPDTNRARQWGEPLFMYTHDYELVPWLALSAEPNATADVWTVKLRPDVIFHNGKTMTAKDVVWTFRDALDPKHPKGAESFPEVDPKRIRAVDELTVEFGLKRPNGYFHVALGNDNVSVKPENYDPKDPIATGPFMFGELIPGDRSLFKAHKDYWGEGPYVDEVETINFKDVTAMVNALQGGQIDAAGNLPASQVKLLENAGFKVVISETGRWNYFFFDTAIKPWSDVRVRQAMRLIIDRQEMVDLALEGLGRVGNDMWSIVDPLYPSDFPQRTQDIEQAKSLLKQAGYSDLSFDFFTTEGAAGLVESSQVFAEQAKKAGVKVNVKKIDVGEFWGDKYLTWPNGPGYFSSRWYLMQCLQTKVWNEAHWKEPGYWERIDRAFQTTDEDERSELIRESFETDYNIGPWTVWSYANMADAYAANVQGVVPSKLGVPYNGGFVQTMWLT